MTRIGHRPARSIGVAAMATLASFTLVACGGADPRDRSAPDARSGEPTTELAAQETTIPGGETFSGQGPYAAGWTSFDVGGVTVEVFYPVARDNIEGRLTVTSVSTVAAFPDTWAQIIEQAAPFLDLDLATEVYPGAPVASDGPFPAMLYSHGASSHPQFAVGHLAHTASWGFVVAAPSHPSRNLAAAITGSGTDVPTDDVTDLAATWTGLQERAADVGDPLHAAVATDLVALAGHSTGGAAALRLGADGRVDGTPVVTVISQAPTGPSIDSPSIDSPSTGVPVLLVVGRRDGVVGIAAAERTFEQLDPPRQLVVMANAGHNVFLDSCAPIRAQGGLLARAGAFVNVLGPEAERLLALSEDGCTDGYLDPGVGMALSRHLVVAQLRWAFGIDSSHAALDPSFLSATFGPAVDSVEFTP
jgi:predicted dienelactone hydrolase